MSTRDRLMESAERLAAAIGGRDAARIEQLLAAGFVHRTHGGPAANAAEFLTAIDGIPGEITFVRLEDVEIDVTPAGALVIGVQHAQVRVAGDLVDDRRRFVDRFVEQAGE